MDRAGGVNFLAATFPPGMPIGHLVCVYVVLVGGGGLLSCAEYPSSTTTCLTVLWLPLRRSEASGDRHSGRTDLSGRATGHILLWSIHGLQATQDTSRVKPCWSTRPLVTAKAMDNPVGLSHSYTAAVQRAETPGSWPLVSRGHRTERARHPQPAVQKSGSPGDHEWQPLFLPVGLAVVGLPHPDSTIPRGWRALVVEAPYPGGGKRYSAEGRNMGAHLQ